MADRKETLSIHDNILYGVTVVSGAYLSRSYSIRLHTAFLDLRPFEYTDIEFSGVVAHHFGCELPNSILFDIEETELERIYNDHRDLFERLKNYGWPFPYKTEDDLIASLKTDRIKAFTISSSYGFEGWIWAEQVIEIKRSRRKRFS